MTSFLRTLLFCTFIYTFVVSVSTLYAAPNPSLSHVEGNPKISHDLAEWQRRVNIQHQQQVNDGFQPMDGHFKESPLDQTFLLSDPSTGESTKVSLIQWLATPEGEALLKQAVEHHDDGINGKEIQNRPLTSKDVSLQQCLPKPMLGYRNDTILVNRVSGELYKEVSVYESLQSGDYYHNNRIYFFPQVAPVSEEQGSFISVVRNNEKKSYNSGLVFAEYLLTGSRLEYQLCVSIFSGTEDAATIYLFDDVVKFFQYLQTPFLAEKLAIKSMTFSLKTGIPVCSPEFELLVNYPGYYTIAAATPANISLWYTLKRQKLFYDHRAFDTNTTCKTTASIGIPCSHSIQPADNTYVLAYIEPSAPSNPPTTHICSSLESR